MALYLTRERHTNIFAGLQRNYPKQGFVFCIKRKNSDPLPSVPKYEHIGTPILMSKKSTMKE